MRGKGAPKRERFRRVAGFWQLGFAGEALAGRPRREPGTSRASCPQASWSRSCGSTLRNAVNDEFVAVSRSDLQTLSERSSDDRADDPHPRRSRGRADL